jgi:predicted MPP superfamily phosphohydrolase
VWYQVDWITNLTGWTGHLALCVTIINRLQATALDYRLLRAIKLLLASSLALLGLVIVRHLPAGWNDAVAPYWWLCRAWLGLLAIQWLFRRFSPQRHWRDGAEHSTVIELGKSTGPALEVSALVQRALLLPGNQVLQLEVNRKQMPLGPVAAGLAGLTVTHLSDLHISDQLGKHFYQEVCDQANQLSSDLICLSGDLVDRDHCRSWLADTLGRLQARLGVFFVLGNHDARHSGDSSLRQDLARCGLIDLAGQSCQLATGKEGLLLGGTEVPWSGSLEQLESFPGESPVSLLVSHSPDTIRWACRRQVSLVLAGHLHGGQIRLPLLGPVVSPSRYGVRFAGGRYRCGNTLLHVSRGVAGMQPLRWNCRPELTQLELTDDPLP